jgi:hypothetical protein
MSEILNTISLSAWVWIGCAGTCFGVLLGFVYAYHRPKPTAQEKQEAGKLIGLVRGRGQFPAFKDPKDTFKLRAMDELQDDYE